MASLASELGRALVNDPAEAWGLLREKVSARLETYRPKCSYTPDQDWERRLHDILGIGWPCDHVDEFWAAWPEVLQRYKDEGVEIGRGTFGGWGDGEPALVRAIWCLVRHLRPASVVETGVARGFTSRFILDALERNGSGALWSIDLPPPNRPELHSQIGSAVPDHLRHRWTYLKGTSRQHLPGLLAKLGQIDLFIHDSAHNGYNVVFELSRAWMALRPGGAAVVDDIDQNWGFHTFTQSASGYRSVICYAEPLAPDLPRFEGRGLFGIICKDSTAGSAAKSAGQAPAPV